MQDEKRDVVQIVPQVAASNRFMANGLPLHPLLEDLTHCMP